MIFKFTKYLCLLPSVALCVYRVTSGACPAVGHSAGHWYTTTWESYSQTEAHRGGLQGDTHTHTDTQNPYTGLIITCNSAGLCAQSNNSSVLFLFLCLSAPVRYVFRCEEQVSAAPGMSWHGGLSCEQRQRGDGFIIRFVPLTSTFRFPNWLWLPSF